MKRLVIVAAILSPNDFTSGTDFEDRWAIGYGALPLSSNVVDHRSQKSNVAEIYVHCSFDENRTERCQIIGVIEKETPHAD